MSCSTNFTHVSQALRLFRTSQIQNVWKKKQGQLLGEQKQLFQRRIAACGSSGRSHERGLFVAAVMSMASLTPAERAAQREALMKVFEE